MKILIDILHPAHAHFFKQYIAKAHAEKHEVTIVTRNKEITNALLDKLGIKYTYLTTPATGAVRMAIELIIRWFKIFFILRQKRIDVAMSISGLCTALPARLNGIPNVNFTDTEDAVLSNRIAFPFSDLIVTPDFYLNNLGRKHFEYNGMHELAYLKNFDFTSLSKKLHVLGLPEQYVIIRLVSKDALHDIGIEGIPVSKVEELIKLTEKFGRVYLNSQSPLPRHLMKYKLSVPIEDIHSVLAGASLFIGESPTMAVESSLLGTPAFLISSRWRKLGNMIQLENDHNLLYNFSNYHELLETVTKIDDPKHLKKEWQIRAAQFRNDSVNIVDMIDQALLHVLSNTK